MTLNVMPFVIINNLMASLILNGLIEPNANRLNVYIYVYDTYIRSIYLYISFSRRLSTLIGRATVVKKRPNKAAWPGWATVHESLFIVYS